MRFAHTMVALSAAVVLSAPAAGAADGVLIVQKMTNRRCGHHQPGPDREDAHARGG